MTEITQPAQSESQPDDSTSTVLIVEDEPLLRMLAVDIVEEAGLAAIEANDADEAIEILEQRADIGIVFTDVNMPGSMSGTELASRIRDRWPPIQLVVTSGKRHVGPEQLPAGTVFVSKPYDIDDIVNTLQRLTPQNLHEPQRRSPNRPVAQRQYR
jgi:CheY-like chemotaxis protein